MTELKIIHEIMKKVRFEEYPAKKATGYDFYHIENNFRQEAIKWIKHIHKNPYPIFPNKAVKLP